MNPAENSLHLVMIIAAALMVLVGIVFIYRGLFGRKISEHQTCRRCGYELVGKTAIGPNCPECGVDIGKRMPVKGGSRYRRLVLACTGLTLFVCPMATVGIVGAGSLKELEWIHLAPDSYLASSINTLNMDVRTRVIEEIQRRLNDEKMSDASLMEVYDIVAEEQMYDSNSWDPELGNLIESVLCEPTSKYQNFASEHIDAYLRRAIPKGIGIHTNRVCRAGGVLRLESDQFVARSGNGRRFALTMVNPHVIFESRDGAESMPCEPFRWGRGCRNNFVLSPRPRNQWVMCMRIPEALPSGEYNVRFQALMKVRGIEGEYADLEVPILGTQAIEIVATDEDAFIEVPTLATSSAIQDSINVSLEAYCFGLEDSCDLNCLIEISGAPCNVGFYVEMEVDGVICAVMNCAQEHGIELNHSLGEDLEKDVFMTRHDCLISPDSKTATVTLISDPRAAEFLTTKDQRIWGGEIVLEDVPIDFRY